MKFQQPLLSGRLIKRYKRFLADVELPGGKIVTAHCPNTGSMMGCADAGNPVWLSQSNNPNRKYSLTLEIIEVRQGIKVGINTGLSNHLVREAIESGTIPELQQYERIRSEVRYGAENSRIDLLLESDTGLASCYVEVKNVTAAVDNGIALFPDAVSGRGTKHLRELMATAASGHRAVLCFCVQRKDVEEVHPADHIDPLYGKTLRQALAHGVEAIAYQAEVTISEITLHKRLPVVCP